MPAAGTIYNSLLALLHSCIPADHPVSSDRASILDRSSEGDMCDIPKSHKTSLHAADKGRTQHKLHNTHALHVQTR